MKDIKYIVFVFISVAVICLLSYIAANVSYGTAELNAFNKLNHTEYTMDQWRVYQYEIKKLHPFVDQK